MRLTGWALMAGEVPIVAGKVIARIEASGMRREDLDVERRGDTLTPRRAMGIGSEATEGRWRVLQCANGGFRRDVCLPVSIKAGRTMASLRGSFTCAESPNYDEARAQGIAVQTA